MVTVDILEVLVSQHNNRYLLLIQDCMTKWAEVIPIPNQTATRIIAELIEVFSCYGIPDILYSDQGRNFESIILLQTLEAIGVTKSHTTAYHLASDGLVERFNRTLLQMLRMSICTVYSSIMNGRNIFTAQFKLYRHTHVLACLTRVKLQKLACARTVARNFGMRTRASEHTRHTRNAHH